MSQLFPTKAAGEERRRLRPPQPRLPGELSRRLTGVLFAHETKIFIDERTADSVARSENVCACYGRDKIHSPRISTHLELSGRLEQPIVSAQTIMPRT